jgi:hypothetical protein
MYNIKNENVLNVTLRDWTLLELKDVKVLYLNTIAWI